MYILYIVINLFRTWFLICVISSHGSLYSLSAALVWSGAGSGYVAMAN